MFASVPALALFVASMFAPSNIARAQVAPSLGTAYGFSVLGGSTVTNTGSSTVTGDVGVDPGTSLTGFPPGTILRGQSYVGDAAAGNAQRDVAAASAELTGQSCTTNYGIPTDLGGMTLLPGVYCFLSSAQLTGELTLDAKGNPNAVWIFKTGSTLTTASNAAVQLVNSAQPSNVFWQVGSSATLGTGTAFEGNIIALASITLDTGATLAGRALAQNGAVTLDDNAISHCVCIQPYNAIASTVVQTVAVAPAVGGVPGTVFGASLSPDGQSVWVSGYNGITNPGFVSLLNVQSLTVTNKVTVGLGPADIAFTFAVGRAFISNYYGASLSVVTVPALKVIQTLDLSGTPLSDPFGVIDASAHLYVTTQGTVNQGRDNFVANVDVTSPLVADTALSLPGQSGRPAIVPSHTGQRSGNVLIPVFVTGTSPNAGHPALAIVNQTQATVIATVTLPSSSAIPEAVVVSQDGQYAYVSLFDSTGGTGGVWVVSLANLTTETIILTCDPENYGEAISKDGKYLLVAGFSEGQVALIDTATDTVDAIIQVGNQPNAIVLTGDNSEAFVTNQADGTVTVISFAPSL